MLVELSVGFKPEAAIESMLGSELGSIDAFGPTIKPVLVEELETVAAPQQYCSANPRFTVVALSKLLELLAGKRHLLALHFEEWSRLPITTGKQAEASELSWEQPEPVLIHSSLTGSGFT